MRRTINTSEAVISSQKCPKNIRYYPKTNMSTHIHMFFDDFTRGFHYDFSPVIERCEIYNTTPEHGQLKKLINSSYSSFFDYDFDKILTEILHILVIKGKAHTELVFHKNIKNELVGISFQNIPYIFSLRFFSSSMFCSLNANKLPVFFKIPNKVLIKFNLKDIGIKKRTFATLLKKYFKLDANKSTSFILDEGFKKYFDYNTYNEKYNYKLISIPRKIGWLSRRPDNVLLSEGFLLYQQAKYLSIKRKILDYFVGKINESIRNCNELQNDEKIIVTLSKTDYLEAFSQYYDGKINTVQLNEILHPSYFSTKGSIT